VRECISETKEISKQGIQVVIPFQPYKEWILKCLNREKGIRYQEVGFFEEAYKEGNRGKQWPNWWKASNWELRFKAVDSIPGPASNFSTPYCKKSTSHSQFE